MDTPNTNNPAPGPSLKPYAKVVWDDLKPLNGEAVCQALAAAGDRIHTFSGNGGCDVPVESVINSVQLHGARKGSDEWLFMCMGMRLEYEVAVIDPFGQIILVKLKEQDLPD